MVPQARRRTSMIWVVIISLFLVSVVPAIRRMTLEPLTDFLAQHRSALVSGFGFLRNQIFIPVLALLTFAGAFYALIGSSVLFLEPKASWHWLTTGLSYPSALVGGVLGFCSGWSLRSKASTSPPP